MDDICYKVAGHLFLVMTEHDEKIRSYLPSYEPFRSEDRLDIPLFVMTIGDEPEIYGTEINRFEWDGSGCVIYRGEEGYAFELFPRGATASYIMRANLTFSKVFVSLKGETQTDAFVLNNFLMMTFAFASASYKTLMIHASVIRNNGYGYLFLGKSGTGKSTHSRLWMDHIPGSDLLNDDNPIVRIVDGIPVVFGSPWSGKTPCYRNLSVPVGAFVKLSQAPVNKIDRTKPIQGFAIVLSSCSLMKWDERIYDGICDTISETSLFVPVYTLDCLPDAAAAELSYNTIHV